MLRPTIALTIACCSLFSVRAVHAQAPLVPPHALSLTVGVAQSARFDEAVSPDIFAGRGPELSLTYWSRGSHADLMTSFRAGTHALDATSGVTPHEQTTQAALHFGAFAPHARTSTNDGPSFGVDVQTSAALIAHDYSGPTPRRRRSPLARPRSDRQCSGRGRSALASAHCGSPCRSPVLSCSRTRTCATSHRCRRLQWTTAAQLQAASATLSYEPRYGTFGNRVGLRYEYRAEMLRYDRVLPVREFTQSVSIGVTWGRKSTERAP